MGKHVFQVREEVAILALRPGMGHAKRPFFV